MSANLSTGTKLRRSTLCPLRRAWQRDLAVKVAAATGNVALERDGMLYIAGTHKRACKRLFWSIKREMMATATQLPREARRLFFYSFIGQLELSIRRLPEVTKEYARRHQCLELAA